MEEDLKKLKVPELKQVLKDKGLSLAGTKPDLIKRLIEAGASEVDASDPIIDEDEILKDDTTPAVAAPVVPKVSTVITEAKSKDIIATDSNSNAHEAVTTDKPLAGKPAEIQKLTDAERLKLRAEKFGATSEQAKKDIRAQRFGIALSENKSGNISSSTSLEDAEKLKKRAERFGFSASKVTEDERKRKRAERFGTSQSTSTTKTAITLNTTDSELEAKKRKRAERFGLT